ncbi:MAG: hypothetical protein JNN03_04765 [Rubrivivax sp.]|nr:hypothetical protein [Rubrivivax sp.]
MTHVTLLVWRWVTYLLMSPYLTLRVPENVHVCPSCAQTCQLTARPPAASCSSVSSMDIT